MQTGRFWRERARSDPLWSTVYKALADHAASLVPRKRENIRHQPSAR